MDLKEEFKSEQSPTKVGIEQSQSSESSPPQVVLESPSEKQMKKLQEKTLEGITRELKGESKRYKKEINTNEEIKLDATMASSQKEDLGPEDF